MTDATAIRRFRAPSPDGCSVSPRECRGGNFSPPGRHSAAPPTSAGDDLILIRRTPHKARSLFDRARPCGRKAARTMRRRGRRRSPSGSSVFLTGAVDVDQRGPGFRRRPVGRCPASLRHHSGGGNARISTITTQQDASSSLPESEVFHASARSGMIMTHPQRSDTVAPLAPRL